MHDSSDMDLLRDYARHNSEAAFAELVRRHIALVYSAALRQVGSAAHSEEITQAVFILLARKAAALRSDTILEGWLYETTRLTALSFLRGERRRQFREQEAYMQSTLEESTHDSTWHQLAPLLDEAMSRLGKKDRDAVVLRFFKDQGVREVAGALRVSEAAAQRRILRAVEKLRKFFTKRGVVLSSVALAGAISANSIQAAPVALAKSVTVMAVAKGAAASGSTLTLMKGALKIMAWTKAKSAIVAGVVVLFAAGTAPVVVREYEEHRTYSWQLAPFPPPETDERLRKTPPQVQLLPSKYTNLMLWMSQGGLYTWVTAGGVLKTNNNVWKSIGVGVTLESIVRTAYGVNNMIVEPWRIVYLTKIPDQPLYDYISNLTNNGSRGVLQQLIKKKFGIVAHWELLETNVIVVKLSNPAVQGLKPAGSLLQSMNLVPTNDSQRIQYNNGRLIKSGITVKNAGMINRTRTLFNAPVERLWSQLPLENTFHRTFVDETGLTNHYDFTFTPPRWDPRWSGNPDLERVAWSDAFLKQLGLELIPAKRTIEMLVIEKAN